MISSIIVLWIICGFIYGINYFLFFEPYSLSSTYIPIGFYILSLKWWNIEFNWFTYLGKWQVDFKIKIFLGSSPKRYKEYYLIFSSTGIKTCTININ